MSGVGALQNEGTSWAKLWGCETASFRNKGAKVDGSGWRAELQPLLLQPISCLCELCGALWNQAESPIRQG